MYHSAFSVAKKEFKAMLKGSAMTTQQIIDMIGQMRTSNRAAFAARTLAQILPALDKIT